MSKDTPDELADDVVDGEIVSEEDGADASGPAKSGRPGNLAAKAGWGLAVLLATFLGGILAQPWISERLVALGLMAEPVQQEELSNARELDALKTRLAAQERMIDSLGSRVESQQAALEDARSRTDQTENDLALLAAREAGGQPASQGIDPELVASLQQEVDSLRTALEQVQARDASPSEVVPDNNSEVEAIKGRLELERAETGVLKTRLAALEEALARASAGDLSSSPRGRLALSLSDLQKRIEAGEAFASALGALRLDLTLLPALDQQKAGGALVILETHQDGIASHLDLVNGFPGLVRAVKIAAADGEAKSWMTSLFVTRDKGSGAGPVDAALNRAEQLLAARHLAGAIAALEAIDVPASDGMSAWLGKARDRLAVLSASDSLFALAAGAPAGTASNAEEVAE